MTGRVGGQLAEGGAPAGGRMRDDARVHRDLRRRHLPTLRGRGHQHGARGGAGPTQLLPGIGDRAAAAGALRRPEGQIVVARGVGRGGLDADLRPVGVQLLGEQGRETRVGALAELDVLGDDRDGVVRRDPHEGVRREYPRRGRVALGEGPVQPHADQEAHPDGGAALEESSAARHHKARAAS